MKRKQSHSFDELWESERGFWKNTDTLYAPAQKLCELGANPKFLFFLARTFPALIKEADTYKPTKTEVDSSRSVPTYASWSRLKRRFVFGGAPEEVPYPKSLTRNSPAEIAKQKTRRVIRQHFIETGEVPNEVECRKIENCFMAEITKDRKETRLQKKTAYQAILNRIAEANPTTALIMEYFFRAPVPGFGRRNATDERSGSFFLLVLSEHMRARTNNPHFKLCLDFWKALGIEPLKTQRTGKTAQRRVQRLKVSFQQWEKHLRTVNGWYRLSSAARKKSTSGASLPKGN